MRTVSLQKLILVSMLSLSFFAFAEISFPIVDQVKTTVNSEEIRAAKSFLQKHLPTKALTCKRNTSFD
jgi:hypothetical protein